MIRKEAWSFYKTSSGVCLGSAPCTRHLPMLTMHTVSPAHRMHTCLHRQWQHGRRLEHVCVMVLSLHFPVTCNSSRAVTLPKIGVPQYIGDPHRVTYPYVFHAGFFQGVAKSQSPPKAQGFKSQPASTQTPFVKRTTYWTLAWYRGTSLIRNRPTLAPYSRPMPRALFYSWGGGVFL